MKDPGDLWKPWTVTARNLPEHADNRIHTDEGARAAGFPAALVAGVTTYAYLTRPVVVAWGQAWLTGGSVDLVLRSPVFTGDSVVCTPSSLSANGIRTVEALVDGEVRARIEVSLARPSDPGLRSGEPVRPLTVELRGEFSSDYGERAGDDFTLYRDHHLAHPAVWPALANRLVHRRLVQGPWIHTRSRIHHHASPVEGSLATARGVVVDRHNHRLGRKNHVDVEIVVDGQPVATLRHEYLDNLNER